MTYRFNPLYYVDFRTYTSEKGRKVKYVNFITKLKKEINKIKNVWICNEYLKNKTIGETGRNASAHGTSGRRTARYDYSINYKHINDVNIFLELIARYIIEKLNPQLTNIVERRVKYYIQKNLGDFLS